MAMLASTVSANGLRCGSVLCWGHLSLTLKQSMRLPTAKRTSWFAGCRGISTTIPISKDGRKGLGWLPSFCTISQADSVKEQAMATAKTPSNGIADESGNPDIRDVANLLDIRVGRILKAWRHEEADSLYVEEVDIGEPEPRIICSGLVNYISLDQLQDKKVVVLSNLKPRNMRGVKSCGMLMAASDASHEHVELLVPPEDAVPGERVWFGSESAGENQPPPATPNQIQKKKIWEQIQPFLKTNESCVAMLGMHELRASGGAIMCGSLKNANIS